ncbi:Tfp pilus assembly protein PilV [Raoultella planticola]|uniref:Tfp pilus assembly protein PilV n=1 Tax=Raoultella planticola TaxID=575 RepID=A0A485BRZ7_RAOPL|nr:Tfp pilus assembly protein PilV [Raoultella planticola]
MSDAVNHEQGFSLPETLLAMTLLVMVVTALGGYQRGLANGFIQLNQYRQLWRDAWRYGQMNPPEIPPGGSVTPLADIGGQMCQHHGNDHHARG